MAKTRNAKNSFISVNPSPCFYYLFSNSPLASIRVSSPKKNPRNRKLCTPPNLSLFFLSLLVSFTFLGISVLSFMPIILQESSLRPLMSPSLVSFSAPSLWSAEHRSRVTLASLASTFLDSEENEPILSNSVMVPLPAHGIVGSNVSEEEKEFWQQPDGEGYRPCLDFSIGYRKASVRITKEKRRFLMVVVSGGLNQQRNEIVDAVVIARILEAALVVPVLQVNQIWGDESEFSEIFDVKHFKRTLQADVRVVSSLPSTHLLSRQTIETKIPRDVSPLWIRSRFFRKLNEDGVFVFKGLDSKLSKNLPSDLQKLRCKVAFHALRYAAPIRELGNRLARRMWIEGPYIALHLRLEKDVWVRTGCRTGLGAEYDDIISMIRGSQPEYLTARQNMSYLQRRLAGQCPLNSLEMARLLKALGAPGSARVYKAGGEPFGGKQALQPLLAEFPNLVTKDNLARDGELSQYSNRSSALAAIDYIVSLSSAVFVPSHGGNMGRAMQGHRAYVGHRKYIKPNKRSILPLLEDTSISDAEFSSTMRKLHVKSQGQPEMRTNRRDRDVIAYPVPECMCKHSTGIF
ncbi:hypothetical protein I3843_12G036400 [Carya illinoinensis]|uniref:O-fucosyltransferase family protein n=1 Tax=Carya illinoinensis TaxID=32201 RepID=A0A8T1NNU7_CARIL|nr:O-fucosyltransferase 37 [Carya illinoinensis]KAG6633279.1 hypothetical protein CIPAW_12G037200 [Carya illinoinensis]KAG7952014.1 hypothetical protein I3843_12G036400 [Carya illinoinensis]